MWMGSSVKDYFIVEIEFLLQAASAKIQVLHASDCSNTSVGE
jgi:hypothetical protein